MTFFEFHENKKIVDLKQRLIVEGVRCELNRGDVLCHIGTKSSFLGVVSSGMLKYSRLLSNGRERILSFAFTGDLVANYSAMRFSIPNLLDVVAMESTVIYKLPIAHVDAVPDIRALLSEEVAAMALSEAIDIGCNSPSERYVKLISRFPNIHNQMSNRTIASYLGITPESLCRLRKRLLTEQ